MVVLDNSSTHKTPSIHRWLLSHPRVQFHFTPTSSSWMNLVERWFAELTNKWLRRGRTAASKSWPHPSPTGRALGMTILVHVSGTRRPTTSSTVSQHVVSESLTLYEEGPDVNGSLYRKRYSDAPSRGQGSSQTRRQQMAATRESLDAGDAGPAAGNDHGLLAAARLWPLSALFIVPPVHLRAVLFSPICSGDPCP
jgi:hypothetical protein